MKNFLYIPSAYQLTYVQSVKARSPKGCNFIVKNSETRYLTEITQTIMKLNTAHGVQIHGIIVSNANIVAKYVAQVYGSDISSKSDATLDSYQGCMFEHTARLPAKPDTTYKIPVVVVPTPESLPYSMRTQFLWDRYISKLYDTSWFQAPELQWTLLDTKDKFDYWYKEFKNSILMSLDIETKNREIPYKVAKVEKIQGVPTEGMWYLGFGRTDSGNKAQRAAYNMPIITCIGYTGIFLKNGKLTSHTVVIPINSMQKIRWMRLFNALHVPKTMQNGRYDSLYCLRYNAPISHYFFDTYMLMHSWYCELPRRLEVISALTIRNHMYWKDESGSNLYLYNAKDCHNTAWATLVLLKQLPDWARANYLDYFKQQFFTICCSLEGFMEDRPEAIRLQQQYEADIVKDQEWWNKVMVPNFNVSSPKQVKQLFINMLRTGVKDTGKNTLKAIVHKHPLYRLMVDRLLQTREYKKADSTYMNVVTFCGRILYDLDPAGTDTGRYASKSSSFWCGTQIQNIPLYVKSKFIADSGYVLVAIDNAQSESRTTAYTTLDYDLIDAVENSKDFHVRNASRFFGIAEEELFEYKKSNPSLFKKIRNKIGKRVNHGANYNMGANVLISTMTPEEVIAAKHTLGLPSRWTLVQVAEYLLDCFDKAYPKIRSRETGGYHRMVIDMVRETNRLTTPDGWTRYTFHQDPENNKKHLNQLVAQIPQSWSVRIINRAGYDGWIKYQILGNKCRFKGQVHDELLFQVKPEHEEEVTKGISTLMARPNRYTDENGNDAYMVIPNDPVGGGKRWSDLKD